MMSSDAILYGAKSTADTRGSIGTQLADGRKLAEDNGLEVVAEYSDEAASAYHGDRGDGLARAMAHAERLAADGRQVSLVVQHSDRLARGDAKQAKHLVEYALWAIKSGVTIRSVQDASTFEDLLRAVLTGERNHEDSKRKAKAVSDGLLRRAVNRGKSSGGPRPYGYRWAAWLDDNGQRQSQLDQVPAEVPIVVRMFGEYLGGRSQMAIAKHLNRDGIPTSTGAKWIQGTVRNILRNPIYCGRIRHAGGVYPGAHDPIVSVDVWEGAQRVSAATAAKRNHGGGRVPKGKHLFTRGLLRCGKCGQAMSPRTYRESREVYQCLGHVGDVESCSQPPVWRAVIDEAMMDELDRRYLDMEATQTRYAARRAADVAVATESLATAERDLARADDALARIESDYVDGKITADQWNRLEARLTEGRDAVQAAVERARKQTEALADDDLTTEALNRVRDLRAVVLGGLDRAPDLDALRKLLGQMFDHVTYIPGPCGATLAFTLKLDIMDMAALAAGSSDWPIIPQAMDLPTSDANGLASASETAHALAAIFAPIRLR